MKNLTKIIISIITISILSLSNYIYGTTSLSSSTTSVKPGDTFTVNVNVSNVATWQLTVSYSSNVSLVSGSTTIVRSDDGIENVNKTAGTLTFKALTNGVANISVSGNSYTADGDPSGSSASKSITISTPVVVTPPPTQTTTPPTNTTQTTTTTTKSSNANLSSLKVNQEGLSPAFGKSKTSYYLSVAEGVTNVNVTAIAENSGAKVSVSGNTNLVQGDNIISILVTAADGTKKTYKITVNKSADPTKANAFLQNLIVENATLSPEFEKETLEYDCGTVASNIEKLSLLAFTENQQAKIEITGNDKLVDGENIIKVKVTAVDGTTTKEYTVKVTKEAAPTEEVNIYPETNSLQDTTPSKFSNFIHGIWMYLKPFWLVLSLLFVCLFELAQIIYLYIKVEKFKKLNPSNVENKDKLNIEEDKTLQTRRRNVELENANNQSWRTDVKKEDSDKKTSDEKIDDISDELVDNSEEAKIDAEDNTDNFEDSIDTEEDK